MFKHEKEIKSSKEELANYISGNDVYNSDFLKRISDPNLRRIDFLITTQVYRPDLIAREVYGDVKYLGMVVIQCGGIDSYAGGRVIKLIDREELLNIIRNEQ